MHARCRIVVVLSLVGVACAAGEDELDTSADVLEAKTADGCEYYTAPNFAHLLSRRAYVTSHPIGFFRVFTYHARGTDELLGLTPFRSTTIYKASDGHYSLSAQKCATRADGGTDAGVDRVSNGLPSAGCGRTAPAPGPGKVLSINGLNRTYSLALPASYDANRTYPLVLAYHGLGSSAVQAERYFGLQQAAGDDAILVYPDALPDTRAWGITGTQAAADLAFFDALVNDITGTTCVDQTRIFATGHSMGAFFANTLGCARGAILRAIAPVAGGGPFVTCDNGKVAALLIAAQDDTVVASAQGESSRDWWLRANRCQAATRAVGPASCVAYSSCESGYPVHWCLEPSGGHAWPSFAGAAIWRFFSDL